ncbi:Lrp/AsnC family transcriptional regulator [Neisseriaceae bacterium JH1-16]|nr:Lrp/AsnC family transcriptional regulator [Neisseriaceae bacterium JH1-16]
MVDGDKNHDFPGVAQMNSKEHLLDRLDWRIIELLQEDARCSNTGIGKQIGLSQPAVTARIRRLEELGVVEGYTARINAKAIGREIGAFIRLRTTHAEIARCLAAFASLPEVVEAHRITGEDCFLIRVVATRMTQLESVIDTLAQYGPVSTSIVLASYPAKPLRAESAAPV